MPLRQPQVWWDTGVQYTDTVGYSNTASTDASGNAIYYLTDNNLASGNALFSNVFMNSLTVTPISSSTIYLNGGATLSADKKTLTIPVRQNTSLLGLGLIPFSTATAGAVVLVTIRGVAA